VHATPPRLSELAEGLWTVEHELRLAGLALGTRTTIARLPDGGLWVHSPGPLDAALADDVRGLGPVRCLVAPNLFHHLYVGDWRGAFPEALVYGVAGLAAKRRDLRIDETLGDAPPAAWRGTLEQLRMGGLPKVEEVAFLHVPSRTLVLSDLCFNIQHSDSPWTRIGLRLTGAWRRFTPSRLFKTFVKDPKALRASVDHVLEWDFDRVLVAHGEVLEHGGPQALREAFRWLGVSGG